MAVHAASSATASRHFFAAASRPGRVVRRGAGVGGSGFILRRSAPRQYSININTEN